MTVAVPMFVNAAAMFLCARAASRLDDPLSAVLEALAELMGAASVTVAVLALAV